METELTPTAVKTPRPYAQVLPIAERIVERLAPACSRLTLAGSLRREAATVGDIEIVAIPHHIPDLFGEPTGSTRVDALLSVWPVTLHKNGKKYVQFSFTTTHGERYVVDLFLQPDPETWGCNLVTRTGPSSFSKRMVTPRRLGGYMPDDLVHRDARLWRNGAALSTPEEQDVFDLYGMEFIAPKERGR